MNYDGVVKFLQTMLEIPLNQSDENFQRVLPQIIEYADNRIYRELDFLATTTTASGVMIARNREVVLPPSVLVLRQINVFVPVEAVTSSAVCPVITFSPIVGRQVLERVSPEALDMFWPQDIPGVPQKYAMIGRSVAGPPQALGHIVRFMPTPDLSYTIEYLGVIRPAPLSASNTTTYLSTIYPDLFCAACMVFASGYQRDFGAQADDPQKAMSWEGQYSSLRQGVMLEAARQKGEAAGWSSLPPAPLAGQPRGGAGA